jgi:STELLO glycosyltransferases
LEDDFGQSAVLSGAQAMTTIVVITSIFAPTEAVRGFAARDDLRVIVVGDQKTPDDWVLEGVEYLSPDSQTSSGFAIADVLPWNHYARKMIGYVAAARRGAQVIVDTDDDNIPKQSWMMPSFDGVYAHSAQRGYVNVYRFFSDELIWPRGFPLRHVREAPALLEHQETARIGIWQFLADEDPDVDAVYRLLLNKEVRFKERSPLVLREGAICPINSQNTAFRREVFPLLYLPAHVSFRFTDILRGIVAQPILWRFGFRVGFGGATVRQERNPHDYLKDFVDEVSMHRDGERAFKLVELAVSGAANIAEALRLAYSALHLNGIVSAKELVLLDRWLHDIRAV